MVYTFKVHETNDTIPRNWKIRCSSNESWHEKFMRIWSRTTWWKTRNCLSCERPDAKEDQVNFPEPWAWMMIRRPSCESYLASSVERAVEWMLQNQYCQPVPQILQLADDAIPWCPMEVRQAVYNAFRNQSHERNRWSTVWKFWTFPNVHYESTERCERNARQFFIARASEPQSWCMDGNSGNRVEHLNG